MHWSEVWYGEDSRSAAIRTALTPASWLYAAGWNAYAAMYSLGLKRAKAPHKPVVCVGNLVVGGSGKTPLTIHVAEVMERLGYSVVLSCSGYGSPGSENAALAPSQELSPKRWGDEPAMLRWLMPDCKLIVGRNRLEAARICRESFPDATLLMDDGFQHLPVRKHVSLLVDPPTPNHRCLPAGPYREPMSHRRRADLVLPGEFEIVKGPLWFVSPSGEQVRPSAPSNVLCALGNPGEFRRSLEVAGVKIRQFIAAPDHDPLDGEDLLGSLPKGEPLVVTAKDWVKLREREDLNGRSISIARQEVAIEPHDRFEMWLLSRLNEVTKA